MIRITSLFIFLYNAHKIIVVNSCKTATPDDECYSHVEWARLTGVIQYPQWYEGLTSTSTFEEVQQYLHNSNLHNCPAPCSSGSEWNIHYQNKNYNGIAKVVNDNNPDIIGFCESTNTGALAGYLKNYQAQPGVTGGFQGYGADIFYKPDKYEAVSGSRTKINQCGSRGGDRAANVVTLKGKNGNADLIVGGLHLSYCGQPSSCPSTQQCELDVLYRKLNEAKANSPNSKVIWMGDMNLKSSDSRFNNNGYKDVSQVGHSYFTGGRAIDHIWGSSGVSKESSYVVGTINQKLSGADHHAYFII
eukprot:Pgem_evm1s14652